MSKRETLAGARLGAGTDRKSGDRAMRAIRPVCGPLTLGALLLALAPAAAAAAPVPADEEKALREKALQLNDITGDDPITGMIITLVEEKEKTKKLLAIALKMSKNQPKDKPPLFNVNATWILGRTAHRLKDAEAGEHFLRLNAAQALKLYSTKKFVGAYEGLVDLLYENKRYAEVEKICREILELEGDREIESFKVTALEMLAQSLAKQGKTEQAMTLLDNLIKSARKVRDERSEILLSRLQGQILREAGKFEDAAKLYE